MGAAEPCGQYEPAGHGALPTVAEMAPVPLQYQPAAQGPEPVEALAPWAQ